MPYVTRDGLEQEGLERRLRGEGLEGVFLYFLDQSEAPKRNSTTSEKDLRYSFAMHPFPGASAALLNIDSFCNASIPARVDTGLP